MDTKHLSPSDRQPKNVENKQLNITFSSKIMEKECSTELWY